MFVTRSFFRDNFRERYFTEKNRLKNNYICTESVPQNLLRFVHSKNLNSEKYLHVFDLISIADLPEIG